MFFHDVTYVLELLQRVCAHCFAGVILRDSRIDLVHLFALIVLSAGRSVAGCLIHASALWLLLSFCITQRRPPGRDGIRLRPSPALMVQFLGLEQMALQTGWLMIKVYDSLLSTQHSSMSGLYSPECRTARWPGHEPQASSLEASSENAADAFTCGYSWTSGDAPRWRRVSASLL